MLLGMTSIRGEDNRGLGSGVPRATGSATGKVLLVVQGGLGEASCLALTSHYSGRPVITAWSSGTGFAGVFGYSWVGLLHVIGAWPS